MKRRILSLILAFVFIVALLPAGTMTTLAAPAAEQTKSSEIIAYPVTGGYIYFVPDTGTVTGYEGAITELNIPAEINDVPVIAIGEDAFYDCDSLSSIDIPDSVTTIGAFAFDDCENLTNVNLPDSVTTIGDYAFSWCYCLTNTTIPDSVTTIGECAFFHCDSLTSVTIPDSVMTIGSAAFAGCDMLEEIWVNANNPNYCSDKAGIVFNKNKTKLVACPGALYDEYTVPDGVTTIDPSAFAYCRLTDITLPDSLTTIGNDAFYNCYRMTRIEIPASVTFIGEYAFSACYDLTGISLPDSLITIGDYAFYQCDSLTNIYYSGPEEQWNEIEQGYNDFSGVEILFNSTMPQPSEPVAYPVAGGKIYFDPQTGSVISSDINITTANIPASIKGVPVVAIGGYAFSECENLTKVTLPDSVVTIGECAFNRCENLTSITMQKGVTTINDSAFAYCYSLNSVTIPDTVTIIGDGAFEACISLSSLTIPDGVTTIGEYAFGANESLTSVTISDSVTTIGTTAFLYCSMLEKICVNENNPNYSSDEKGVLFNKNKTELVTCPGALSGEYTIPDSVTTIGEKAFEECTNLTAVTIPDSVTTIGAWAFCSCDNLTRVTIPDSVTSIGEYAFWCCFSLSNITIPDGVTSIGYGTFVLCNSLTSIKIPDSVRTIGEEAFSGCYNLISVTIPDSVATIGNEAFSDCYNLSVIYYNGSQAQWEKIKKGDNDFSGAVIHFCPSANFGDIPVYGNWAHDGIDYCVEQELMNGTGGNLFNPNGTVSRAQLVTILYRVAGSPATEFKGTFTDVPSGKWYSNAIEWAAANGVVNGIGNGKFGPDQSITREQIATILYRYSGSPTVKGNLDAFPDKGSVSGFAVNGLTWATQEGLINGVSSGSVTSLAPKNNATRAQIASIIMRYCERAQ